MKYQITWEEKCKITYFLAETEGTLEALSKNENLGPFTTKTLTRLQSEAAELRNSLHKLEGWVP